MKIIEMEAQELFTDTSQTSRWSQASELRRCLFEGGVVAVRSLGIGDNDFADTLERFDLSGEVRPRDHGQRIESIKVASGGDLPEQCEVSYPSSCRSTINEPTRNTLVFWHMEEQHRRVLPRTVAINMREFSARPGAGSIGFVDLHELYLDLPDKYKEGLSSAKKLEAQIPWMPEGSIQYPHPIFQQHWWHAGDFLMSVGQGYNWDCEDPPWRIDMGTVDGLTEQDLSDYAAWTFDYVADGGNQHWWDWEMGDFLIYDAMRLAVAWGAGLENAEELMYSQVTCYGEELPDEPAVPAFTPTYEIPKGHGDFLHG